MLETVQLWWRNLERSLGLGHLERKRGREREYESFVWKIQGDMREESKMWFVEE